MSWGSIWKTARVTLTWVELQQKSPLRAGQPTLRNARTLTQKDNRVSADSSEMNESVNGDAIDSEGEDDSSDVVLAFINSDEEDTNERPNTTRWGQVMTIGDFCKKKKEQLSVV